MIMTDLPYIKLLIGLAQIVFVVYLDPPSIEHEYHTNN